MTRLWGRLCAAGRRGAHLAGTCPVAWLIYTGLIYTQSALSFSGHRLKEVPIQYAKTEVPIQYAKTVKLALPYDEAVLQVKDAFKQNGFGALTEVDARSALNEKLGTEVAREAERLVEEALSGLRLGGRSEVDSK
jgi:hypothetical protein